MKEEGPPGCLELATGLFAGLLGVICFCLFSYGLYKLFAKGEVTFQLFILPTLLLLPRIISRIKQSYQYEIDNNSDSKKTNLFEL